MKKLSIAMAAALAFLAIGTVENAKARPLAGDGGGSSHHHRYYGHHRYGHYGHHHYGYYRPRYVPSRSRVNRPGGFYYR
jgi:hypothetical protein